MKKVFFAQPKDRSLQAFKDWLQNMVKRLNPNANDNSMTEEKWIESWQEFWSGVDKAPESQEPNEE